MVYQLIQYVLWGAVRDRLLLTVILSMAIVAALSMFLGSAAIMEQAEFTRVFMAAGLRLVGILGLVLFVVFFIRRSFDTKDVEFMLSRPIRRVSYILSYSVAFSLIAILLGALCGGVVAILSGQGFGSGQLYWTITVIAEYIVVANVALFIAMVLSSASACAMATFGFYLLCRMSGQFLGIADSSIMDNSLLSSFLNALFQVISVFLPRLDLMAQTSWLVYGIESGAEVFILLAQALIFSVLVLCACLMDLLRRQF